MGITLVGKVLARWTSAPHNTFRVLTQMAMTALDNPSDGMPACLYFAGHEPLMLVIPSDPRASFESRERAVQRAIADGVAMGALKRTNTARAGNRQVYQLTLDNAVKPLEKKPDKRWDIDEPPVDNQSQPDTGRHPQPDTGRHPQPDTGRHPQPDTVCRESPTPCVTPRNHEEGLEEKPEEANDLHGPVTPARASPNKDGFIPPPQCGYPECVRGWILPTTNEPPHQCPQCTPAPDNVIPLFAERKAQ